jgi:hypothetical protein
VNYVGAFIPPFPDLGVRGTRNRPSRFSSSPEGTRLGWGSTVHPEKIYIIIEERLRGNKALRLCGPSECHISNESKGRATEMLANRSTFCPT